MNRRQLLTTGVTAGAIAAATLTAARADDDEEELAAIRALLKAHDDALTNHNLDGVLATFADDAVVMGTGPGEIWSGPEELAAAYENFFKIFDKGEQNFEYLYRFGGLDDDMGWMMTSGNVTGKKDGKDFTYPLNISIAVSEGDDDVWKIAAMHYSTVVAPEQSA
ncbi:MAG: SgcJ/EcaC family oxidoreductase [Verrucomicrobiota bacterium]